MGDEGAAEKVYEAGLELVNPGGRPEVLREAAKAWRALGTHLDKFAVGMDRKIQAKHGSEWRGPAADAFMDHWRDVKKSIEDSQDVFTDAAAGLEKAADNIEKVNEEIHQIYIEIGVTVAASAATSFVTLGFPAAAGAANAARLAARRPPQQRDSGGCSLRLPGFFRHLAAPGAERRSPSSRSSSGSSTARTWEQAWPAVRAPSGTKT
jgi:WXG100 family type VII secretion target